ncbi:MAG: phosphatase PAP2 family protein [Actinobacteria bacterium]|nr:phosphatase PAP2 family protein [Actinomycetota bacterium]MCA1722106.1 phosphatase PAP2 family protein [Actinomycetota bacterium]
MSNDRLLTRLDHLDLALYRKAASTDTPLLDRVLPRLTSSANHSVLWIGVSLLLAATGQRRAAVRGLTSLALASATANIPAKLAARRARPELRPVPVPRRLLRQPQTTSFPSGHSASAGAFAMGVALESPLLAAPVAILAAGVAYGRIHTGVHYPGDVAAGLAMGVGSALVVRKVWPVRPDRPAFARPARRPAPALPDGAGLIVVINESAGSGERAAEVEQQLADLLPKVEVVRCGPDDDVEICLAKAAETAQVLGVMGGDGTVNCAAGIALDRQLPLAVLPGGTLDHFAGELGVQSVEDVVAAVRNGSAVEITVGSADPEGGDLYFLNTFAVGVYPELVREREKREKRIGKWPAMAVAMAKIMRKADPVFVEVDGQPRRLWTLFAGNGHYHPAGFAPSWRERLDDGCIDVRLIDADARLSRLRLVVAVLTGRLGESRVYEQRLVGSLPVRSRQGGLRIARDGEVSEGPGHMTLRAATRKLVVYLT